MGQYKSQTSYSKRAHDHTFFLSKYATVENLIEIYISCPKNLVGYKNLVIRMKEYVRLKFEYLHILESLSTAISFGKDLQI